MLAVSTKSDGQRPAYTSRSQSSLFDRDDQCYNFFCIINCDHIQIISKNKIGALITTISNEKIDKVSKAISLDLNLW
jgi:mRNA-degrading endonuclease toxin of MazEF toxin-antitoxin module